MKSGDWQVDASVDQVNDPLLDCLEKLTYLFDKPVSATTLRAGLPLKDDRLTVSLFSRAASRAGLSSRVIKYPLKRLSNVELPAILLLNGYRAVIAIKVNDKRDEIKILLPESGMGSETLSVRELEHQYSGHAIFVQPEYQPQDVVSETLRVRPKHWYCGTLVSSWRIYRDVLAASFMINLFGLATPFFILNVYDRVVPNLAYDTLWVLATGIGVIYVFDFLLRTLRGYFVDLAGKKANLRLSAMLFEKALGIRMEQRPRSVGAFSKSLQEFDAVRDLITSLSITTLVDLPFVVLGLAAIWYISADVVWVQIVAILILVSYALMVQGALKKAVNNSFQASAQKSATLVEGLNGIEAVKALGAESYLQRKLEEAVAYIAKWSSYSRFYSSSVNHVSQFIQSVAVASVVIAGVYLIGKGELSQGGLIACVILSRRVISPMSQVANLSTRFHRAKAAIKNLDGIMQLPVERSESHTYLHRPVIEGGIEIQDMTFQYPGAPVPVLKDISLSIAPGERVGIIGSSGSGKSSLARLLIGLYQPTKGNIAVDGIDIEQIDPAELRHNIGYLPQDVNLFQGSVMENIRMGTVGINDDVVLRAAQVAGVTDFVKKHTLAFDMPVGEQGKHLSGGQRQSVALARALLLDPNIVILDEPTSSLDKQAEHRLSRRLARQTKGKTLVLISHRSSLMPLVDRLVVLEQGRIIADGPRDEILASFAAKKPVV